MAGDDGVGTGGRSRRELLAAAVGVTAAGVALTGCAAGAPAGPRPGGAATGTAPTPGPGIGSAGTVLGAAADVPMGGGTVYEALEVVVTQPVEGDFRGMSAICTHAGCIVNRVVDGLIACPCHGSRYRLDGSVHSGPAPRALAARPVRVENGRIVLAQGADG